MSRDKATIGYMPAYMAALREMQAIYKVAEKEKLNGYNIKDSCLQEIFVLTCSGFGLEAYEKALNIKPNLLDSVQDRRLRVLALLNGGDTPYTFNSIYQKLVNLCGEGNVNMAYATEVYTLRVCLGLKAKAQLKTVKAMLRAMLPCNISLICLLAYNRHSSLRPKTHSQLRAYSHQGLLDEPLS